MCAIYREADFVSEAVTRLVQQYGNEPWFFNAYQVSDDAGLRLQVEVLDTEYHEDIIPRKILDCFLVVIKVNPTNKTKVIA